MNEHHEIKTDAPPSGLPLKPLGVIKNLADSLGIEITYVYEDLIFIEHNAFLLQMSDTRGEELHICFNSESTPEERPAIFSNIEQAGAALGLKIIQRGTFTLSQKDGQDSLQLEFIDD